MSWSRELRDAFSRLSAGEAAEVGFAGTEGLTGELGVEFNLFATEFSRLPDGPIDREVRHAMRNRLAGVLAALHVLHDASAADESERAEVGEIVATAKRLDTRLQGG